MTADIDIAPDNPAELRRINAMLAAEVTSQALMIEKLKHQLAGHNRHRFGSSAEGMDQLGLTFEEDENIAKAAKEQSEPVLPVGEEDRPQRQHNRKPLPDHLEREEKILTPGDQCRRCGEALKTVDEDVTEEWTMCRAASW